MRPPPRLVRRLLLQPAFLVVTPVATLLSPALLLVAAIVSPFVAGRWRPLRVTAFTIIWMQQEVAAIIACTGLWVGARGRTATARARQQHYRLMRWFLRSARRWGERLLDVTVQIDDDGLAEHVLLANNQPLLVLSRHSGPGDTFYLVDMLLDRYGREPRIVMKEILKLDPVIDLAGGRIPSYFVPPRGHRGEGSWQASIASLAAGMDGRGALLLFPEGGNFTEERRRRRLVRLFRRGRRREAEQAGALHNVIAPEPGGTLSALAASPEAAVILVAHSGLSGLGDRWGLFRRAPIDQVFRVHLWSIPRTDIPESDEARRQWLLDCWKRIDAWVAADAARADAAPAHHDAGPHEAAVSRPG